jgi:predicted nucleic acid-binding protein
VWLDAIVASGKRIVIPAIVDYEVRRGLLWKRASAQLRRLDRLIDAVLFDPVTTEKLRVAADVWADARRRGATACPSGAE